MRYFVFDLFAVIFIIFAALFALRDDSGYGHYLVAVFFTWVSIALLVGKAYCKNKDKQS